jgi:8-oxo-dGTP pyrophosphatase MutT (NUDIX family)
VPTAYGQVPNGGRSTCASRVPSRLAALPTHAVSSAILRAMPPRSTRLSAGVVIVREVPEGWSFLLLRAFTHWDFPKGMVEPGEQPLAAAIREVKEESLIEDLQFTWGDAYTETGPYSRGKVARYYLARTATDEVTLPVSQELGRPEHNEYRWVDYWAAAKLVSPRVTPVLKWAAAKIGMKC